MLGQEHRGFWWILTPGYLLSESETEPWVPSTAPRKPGVVGHTCNPSKQDAEAGASKLQGDPRLHREFALKINNKVNQTEPRVGVGEESSLFNKAQGWGCG